MNSLLPKVIVIVGPTASGKSALALELAQKYNSEIISADSRAIYRGMSIGSAKPTLEEQALVPHHLIDIANPDQTISLSKFKSLAEKAIADIVARGKLPILVGGTALYIYAIIDNWQIPEVPPDQNLRDELDKKSTEELWQILVEKDPEAQEFVDPHNKRRIIRALEVIEATGKKLSAQREKGEPLYNPLFLGLDVDEETLKKRIAERTQKMLDGGLIEEVKNLLSKGYDKDLPAFSGIHYREVIDYLDGKISKDEMISLVDLHDYQLTRRQMTWFKKDPRIRWVDRLQALEIVKNFQSH